MPGVSCAERARRSGVGIKRAAARLRGAPYNGRVTAAAISIRLLTIGRLSRLLLHLAWGVTLAGLAFPFLGPERRDRVIMAWSRRLLRIVGVELRMNAAPSLPEGALLVCNHVSWLDVYLVLAAQRVHFVSKSEVRAWPVAGWLAHKTGTLFLQRGRRADTARINAEMRELMAGGAWVAVFPEGTTSDGRGLRRFLPSLLQPAVELDRPIVPAALRYRTPGGDYCRAPAYVEGVSLWQSLMQILSEPDIVGELHFGAPIAPNAHRRELAAQAEAAVAAMLGVSPGASPADSAPRTRGDPPA